MYTRTQKNTYKVGHHNPPFGNWADDSKVFPFKVLRNQFHGNRHHYLHGDNTRYTLFVFMQYTTDCFSLALRPLSTDSQYINMDVHARGVSVYTRACMYAHVCLCCAYVTLCAHMIHVANAPVLRF